MSDQTSQRAALAHRLHSAAIHLLRKLRRQDDASGLTGARLSALSVIVYAGPIRVGDLAAAEQVAAPTMSRLVSGLEQAGLARRSPDPSDGRVQLVDATASGRDLLEEGRRRRVAVLDAELAALSPAERETLTRAVGLLERLNLPADHPRGGR